MESFSEYYQNRPANFFSVTNEYLLREGLIKSVPVEKFVEVLRKHEQYSGDNSRTFINDRNSVTIRFDGVRPEGDDKVAKEFVASLYDQIAVLGWLPSSYWWSRFSGEFMITFEKLQPTELTPEQIQEAPFYHITNSQYVEKILKNGIGPRESQTHFKHTGDRIYLLQTRNVDKFVLKAFASSLYRAKERKLSGVRKNNWSESTMVLLSVDVSPDDKIFIDPIFAPSDTEIPDFRGCYTRNYISPERLKFVKELDML